MNNINWYEVAISAAFTLFFLTGLILLSLETWLLATGQPPITWHMRRAIHQYPGSMFMLGFAVAFAAGALFAHFWWSGAGGGY